MSSDEVSAARAAAQMSHAGRHTTKGRGRQSASVGAQSERGGAYVRVSLDKRNQTSNGRAMAEEIVSPDTQERKARAYCDSMGWEFTTMEQDIDESAYRQHYTRRAGLMRLLDAVKRGQITKIIVFKFNRLSRRLSEFTEICDLVEAAGAGVVSITEQVDTSTPSGRMIRNIMASFAQYQSEELSEQIYETWITKVKSGKRQPGRGPYGTVYNKGMLDPDPETHPVLLAIFQRFCETRSVLGCVDYLTERQIATPDGGVAWGHTVIRGILTNPAYIGQNRFDGQLYDSNWPPLIPLDLWEEVQAILNARRTEAPNRVDSHLLRGHVICGSCSRPMWTQYGKRSTGFDRYYGCVDVATGRRRCRTPWPHGDELDTLVWSTVRSLCQPHQLDRLLRAVQQSAPNDSGAQQRAQLMREQERLKGKVQDLFDLLRDKQISRQQFGDQNRVYAEQIAEAERSLAALSTARGGPATIEDIRAAAQAVLQAGTLETRRLALADLGVKVCVSMNRIRLEIPSIDWRVPLPARLMGDRFYCSAECQSLDYQGASLTDKQLRFIIRTYGRFNPHKIAQRLGRSYGALRTHVSRLRKSGVTIGASQDS